MKPTKFSAALSVCLLMSCSVAADTFVMRDGRSLEGEFLGATAHSAHLRTASGVERIAMSKIQSIRLDSRPEAATRDRSTRSDSAAPRAVIVGLGQAQSIEHPRRSN